MSIKYSVKGVDRWTKRLRDKSKQAQVATDRQLELSSKRIERGAKTGAPVDTGTLKNTIFSVKAGHLTYKVVSPVRYAV